MAELEKLKTEDRNLNITLKNDEGNRDDEVIISLPQIMRKLKKYFLAWFLVAVIIGGVIAGISIFFSTTSTSPVEALVSFTYDGIERGKFPDGSQFDCYSLINPTVIRDALNECRQDVSMVESVREGIIIEAITPDDAMERITTFRDIYKTGTSGQLAAAQAMLAESWYSTQYKLTFKYGNTGLSRTDAVQVLNAILNSYRSYFFKKFGFNEPMGDALATIKYEEYDYSEAVDLFNTTLNTLKRYVNSLATEDTTRFRSTKTGYTFADLRESINTLQSLDIALLDSYLAVNNVSKDKERLTAYYEYRIEMLTRDQTTEQETLETIQESLNNYEKDKMIIFTDSVNKTESTVASDEYDKLINRKITAQNALSTTKQYITFYTQRLEALRKSSYSGSSYSQRAEEDLAKLETKVKNIVQLVKDTSDDYYENVSLSNAYNILVLATTDVVTSVKTGIKNVMLPVIGLEILLFMLYLAVSFISALKASAAQARLEKLVGDAESDADDTEPKNAAETAAETEKTEAESEKAEKKNKKNGK